VSRSRHQPKGGMCGSCTKALKDCSSLHFESMPVIAKSGDAVIVRCTEHRKIKSPS